MKYFGVLSIFLFFLAGSFANAQISLEQFQQISAAFHTEFGSELAAQNARLTINRPPSPQMPNFWWELKDRHASYSSYVESDGAREHLLFLFGGYARIQGMTPDGVAMTLCHELGHGLGGAPFKDKGEELLVSAEGQSDYFAARHCIKRIFKHIPEFQPVQAPSAYTESLCRSHFTTQDELYLCVRGFQALEVERLFFRTQDGIEEETHYETPDQTVVQEVDHSPTFYPSAQCRLDTMMAGLLNQERPRCWWVP